MFLILFSFIFPLFVGVVSIKGGFFFRKYENTYIRDLLKNIRIGLINRELCGRATGCAGNLQWNKTSFRSLTYDGIKKKNISRICLQLIDKMFMRSVQKDKSVELFQFFTSILNGNCIWSILNEQIHLYGRRHVNPTLRNKVERTSYQIRTTINVRRKKKYIYTYIYHDNARSTYPRRRPRNDIKGWKRKGEKEIYTHVLYIQAIVSSGYLALRMCVNSLANARKLIGFRRVYFHFAKNFIYHTCVCGRFFFFFCVQCYDHVFTSNYEKNFPSLYVSVRGMQSLCRY